MWSKLEASISRWRSTISFLSPRPEPEQTRSMVFAIVSASLCVAVCALSWFGYVATREWTRGADLLQQRRATEALALVVSALSRDMKGAWTTLLDPINLQSLSEDPPYDLMQPTARAFARFPYPESAVVWKPSRGPRGLHIFNRSERPPRWAVGSTLDEAFPITLVEGADVLMPVLEELRARSGSHPAYTALETSIGTVPYQIVAHYLYDADGTLAAVVGFTINLEWVRHEYFGPLLTEVSRIGGNEQVLEFEVRDESGAVVVTAGAGSMAGSLNHGFPLLFLDAGVLPDSLARSYIKRPWTVAVAPSSDSTLQRATFSARRTFAMVVIAATISLLSLLLAIRSVRASAAVASMKSEFVSAVTHELKTPLQSIRLVGDTLMVRRHVSPDKIRQYAGMLSEEANRLTHSIDNLLTFARYASKPLDDITGPVALDVHDTVEAALEPFRPLLAQQGFKVSLVAPPDLPRVWADRAALVTMMQNIIDNAIKYAGAVKSLEISVRSAGGKIELEFADQGIGIPAGDLTRVFDRFYRGRNSSAGGSGLGLAIAKRIADFHGGSISVDSTIAMGTTFKITLPSRTDL